ncbi:MAG: helix-hairpin-helix domain-containing protein [Gammaproteobacteria bacterium]|nr:helix-hairpin-helix domain-containing protein [Gammaproteobacteria bacterium]
MKSELEEAPGIGPSIAADLRELGVGTLSALAQQDPEALYRRLCQLRGQHVDRCVLYVFRCGVYFAQNERHNAELLKWWNWKGSADASVHGTR